MNLKFTNILKHLTYTIFSNLTSLIMSTLVILIVPKLIGVKEYSYWQLYSFYASYVGFLHFGFNDGIYLRYGGEEYKNLDKKLFNSLFLELLISQIIISGVIWFGSSIFIVDLNRVFIVKMVAIVTVLSNTSNMLLFILQATNRIREYAYLTILDIVLYVFLIAFFLISGSRDYKLMIYANLIGKFVTLFLATIFCKDIVYQKVSSFYFTIKELVININVGIKLMFANIASMLIIGIVRLGIERVWNVETFGKVSLTLSISNMMMIFINAVGIIMFPVLRRTSHAKLADVYSVLRDFLMILLLGLLFIYFPIKSLIEVWLPQYASSLLYMALVFPMFIYEGKMALLINTYLKTLRREKVLLKINLVYMFMSIISTYIATNIFHNLDLTVLSIVLLLALRSIALENYLAKELNIILSKDIFLELLLTGVFMITAWYINSWYITIIYGSAYIIYLVIKRKKIMESFIIIKSYIKI